MFDLVWQELESDTLPRGQVRRRVQPRLSHDIFLELEKPSGLRSIAMRLRGPVGERWRDVRDSRGLQISIKTEEPGVAEVRIRERDRRYQDIFSTLVADLVTRLAESKGSDFLDLIAERIIRWQAFLETSSDGLSEDRQAGLFAELRTLIDVFVPAVGVEAAVDAWRGPQLALQDFQHQTVAVEVKSSRAAKPATVVISSERQLDTAGLNQLFLMSIAMDARPDGTGARLPHVIQEAREVVSAHGSAQARLEDLLFCGGFLDIHAARYKTRFSVRSSDVFLVKPGFPRLTEAHLPVGVGGVKYHLDLAACEPWRTEPQAVTAALIHTTT